MSNFEQFYIDGQWVDPAEPAFMDRVDPATEEVIGRVALGSAADVDRAVRAAARAFETFQYSSREERIALFDRIIAAFEARREDVAQAITSDIGVPLWFARGYQTDMASAHFLEARRILEDYPFEYPIGDSLIRREAFGVSGLITAWNWPAQIIAIKLAPALAAGCTIVWKPSEFASATAKIIAEIMDGADVPPGVFNLVLGDGPGVGEAISSHPGIALISFTGSKRAGVAISKAGADTVKSVHLELGGKSANIIMPDADLATAVPDGVRRAYFNSGQSCIAPTRMLVHQDQLAEVVAIACETANAMTVGGPLDDATKLGPLANAAQFHRVQDYIRAGIEEGATLACGGLGRPDGLDRGFYIKPTVFSDVQPHMRVAQEEIFGPVLCILSYADEEDAISMANDTSFGLAGYVYSADAATSARVAAQLKAGRIFLNGAPNNAVAPWGGYKESGNGRETGVFGLETYLEVKAVLGQLAAA